MGETVEFYALLLFQIIQVGIYGVLFSMILQPRRKCPRWGMIIILTVVSVFPTYIKVTSSVLSWKGILAVATINVILFVYTIFCFEDKLAKKLIIFTTVVSLSFLLEMIMFFLSILLVIPARMPLCCHRDGSYRSSDAVFWQFLPDASYFYIFDLLIS